MDLNNNPRVTAEKRVKILRGQLQRLRRIDPTRSTADLWDKHGIEYILATARYNRQRYKRMRTTIEQELAQNERVLKCFK